ncbi:MAG: tetratricopeptide repeat protein [Chitinophagales bacterium]|nr:tetratricopeptide repeat protein [Chitinophagales bacterium]MDW8427847.1 tetratricopeptide repeat protein [Chitinophagales bacterium]
MNRYLLCAFLWGIAATGCRHQKEENPAPAIDTAVQTFQIPEIDRLTQLIKKDPNNPNLYYQRHFAFIQHNDLKRAFSDLSMALALDSANLSYYDAMAELALRSGAAQAAVKAYQQLLQRNPNHLEAIIKLSKVFYLQKDYTNSLLQLSRAEALDRSNAEIWFIRGLNLKEMKDTVRAIAAFQKAVVLKPEFYDAYIQLGLLHSNRPSSLAAQYYDNAIRLDSTSVEAYYNKGKFFQDRGLRAFDQRNYQQAHQDFELAKAVYRELITKNPQYELAYFNMGFIYAKQDSLDKAHRMFDLAVKMNPAYAEAYYYRGLMALQKGDVQQAQADFRQCLSLKPDFKKAADELKQMPQ